MFSAPLKYSRRAPFAEFEIPKVVNVSGSIIRHGGIDGKGYSGPARCRAMTYSSMEIAVAAERIFNLEKYFLRKIELPALPSKTFRRGSWPFNAIRGKGQIKRV